MNSESVYRLTVFLSFFLFLHPDVYLHLTGCYLSSNSFSMTGEFLSARSWQGLDRKLGQTPVEKAKEGRSGIAMGYQNEPQ